MKMDVAAATPTDFHPSAPPAMPSKSKLRYPLRSGRKPEEEGDTPSPFPTMRERRPSAVSKSVSVMNKSDKVKSFNPPIRLSGSVKASSAGSVMPISDNRKNKSKIQMKSESPDSEISKITGRRRFNMLSSASYWVTQIKLSEMAAKHSISLGFFKLALDSECEVIREEFKAYAVKHKIVVELGEAARDLLKRYNILEAVESLQLSEKSPHQVADKKERFSCKILPPTKSSRASLSTCSWNGSGCDAKNKKKLESNGKGDAMVMG